MQILDNADLAFLAIIAWPSLTGKMLKVYAKGNILFNEFIYPHLAVMASAYIRCLKKAREEGNSPSKDQIAADLAEAVQHATMAPDMRTKADILLKKYIDDSIPTEEEGKAQLKRLLNREATRKLGAMITMNSYFEELQASLNASKQTIDEITETKTGRTREFVFNPFADIRKLVRFLPRIPTGINWLDQASHGGAREGECWLVLGPTGGGKSTMTVQLSCAQALMGNYTVWVTYEQTLYGDLAERMIANITDTSLDEIRDKGYDGLDSRIREKFDNIVAGVQDKLVCMDMAQFEPDPSDPGDVGDMHSVCKQVKQMLDEGRKVKFVIVDWMGAMASRVFARTGGDMKKDFSSFVQRQVIMAHDFAEENGVFFLFFHQTDTEAQNAKPTFCPHITNARDDHAMGFYFDAGFALGRRDEHDVCWFNPGKTRKANTRPLTLKLIGDRSRFEYAPGWVPNKNGSFYSIESADIEGDKAESVASSYEREME